MISIELVLLVASGLILLSIGIAKLSDNLGVPMLLLFLGVGILAGSDGPGGIELRFSERAEIYSCHRFTLPF